MNSTLAVNTRFNARAYGLFLSSWWVCFFLYPLWYVPGSTQVRVMVFFALMLLYLGCSGVMRWLLHRPLGEAGSLQDAKLDFRFWVILLGGTSLMHAPFSGLPILSGLDTIDHAVMPAVVADAFRDAMDAWVPGATILLFITGVLALIATMVFRFRIVQAMDYVCALLYSRWLLTWFITSTLASLVATFLLASQVPERFGEVDALFRYPPVWKLVLTPVYFVFGLEEEWGRYALILFTYASAFYLYGIIRLFANQTAARVGAMLFVLLPPVFHYGNTHMIEGITLFFVSATLFHWLRFMQENNQADLVMGSILATLGCLTKHPVVGVIPAFALMAGIQFLLIPKTRDVWMLLRCTAASLIPAVTFQTYMELSKFNALIPSELSAPGLDRFLTNLSVIPLGITWPLAILILSGIFSLAATRTWRALWLLGCWFGAFWFLSSISSVYANVRQSLPYYIALLIPAAMFLERITNGRPIVRRVLLWGILPAYLVWACLFMDRVENHVDVGRAIGDRGYINFTTWQDMYLPYQVIVPMLMKETRPGTVIYAPNQNESVRFYIAKYSMEDRVYLRDLWATDENATLESLKQYCEQNNVSWLLLPRGKWLYPRIPDAVIEQLFVDPPPGFIPETFIQYGTVEVGLWRVRTEQFSTV